MNPKAVMVNRGKEASSYAGIMGLFQFVPPLIASGGMDPIAWGGLIAAVMAIVIPEKKVQ